jgi:hypothetical protein
MEKSKITAVGGTWETMGTHDAKSMAVETDAKSSLRNN